MAKYHSGDFLQVPRRLFRIDPDDGHTPLINQLSLPAFKLYIWLRELEHRFTTGEKKRKGKLRQDFFYRSNEALAKDTNMSESSVKKAKKELVAIGFVRIYQMHWIDPRHRRRARSMSRPTRYRDAEGIL